MAFRESEVEAAALAWLEAAGWQLARGADMAAGAEREDYGQAVLGRRLMAALAQLNPGLPRDALDDAYRRLVRPEGVELVQRNRQMHQLMTNGVEVEYRDDAGAIRGGLVRVIDFDDPDGNDRLAVNQFTMVEHGSKRRADLVLFVNGLPLVVVELKNAADEDATVRSAWQQCQTYMAEIPTLFAHNVLIVVSDGTEARAGTLTAGWPWFKPWRAMSDGTRPGPARPELQVMADELLSPWRLLDMARDFVVFEDDGAQIAKKMAGYHQFYAVQVAVGETLRAIKMTDQAGEDGGRYEAGHQPGGAPGDQRVGVIWHTQGSGKSLTMAFYAGRIIRHPDMANPTLVMLTDRNDLDEQLFGTFSRCAGLLRQTPVQAQSRRHLRQLLDVESGGLVFTTIHKFFPDEKGDRHRMLSARNNIVVMADEAHRSQYDFIDGFARHLRDALPCASFIGFTGTPVELQDANTRAVFGDYISIYDIRRSERDGATVPIYYESRLARLSLDDAERPHIDPDFEEVTEGEEPAHKERLKTKWAQMEALVGADKRLGLVAQDLVEHFEARLQAMDGKAMVVCMSRRIAAELYDRIRRLRPQWHGDDDDSGSLKVMMTGAPSDPAEWQQHIRTRARRDSLANRFRNPQDPLRMVIVRDMWLTGFDAPSLHSMYLDKPMRGHSLMQAIARVNRVFRDKPGGLVVDYLGLSQELKAALGKLYRQRRHRPHHPGPAGGGGTAAKTPRDLQRPVPRL